MWIPVNPFAREPQSASPREGAAAATTDKRKKRRRGATAMEYLVCTSFVLVVLIFAVQALGVNTGKLFTSNANATNKTNQ